MSERSDRVLLPADQSRCAPSRPCSMRNRCARVQAAIPQGTALEDFTTGTADRESIGGTALCPGFINVAAVHALTPQARSVKPAVRGLS